MGCETIHIFGKVDDFDGLEGAFFDTNTTTDAEDFRDFAHGWGRLNLNTNFFGLVDRTTLFALLFASFRFAFLFVDDGDSVLVLHFVDEIYEAKYSNSFLY